MTMARATRQMELEVRRGPVNDCLREQSSANRAEPIMRHPTDQQPLQVSSPDHSADVPRKDTVDDTRGTRRLALAQSIAVPAVPVSGSAGFGWWALLGALAIG